MFIQEKMVTLFSIIFLGCSAVAKEISENCDRVQFSFDDQKGINNNQNFTKQSFDKNGKPVYYSFAGPRIQWRYTIIWWNNETNRWLSQTMHDGSDKITKTKFKTSTQNFIFFINE